MGALDRFRSSTGTPYISELHLLHLDGHIVVLQQSGADTPGVAPYLQQKVADQGRLAHTAAPDEARVHVPSAREFQSLCISHALMIPSRTFHAKIPESVGEALVPGDAPEEATHGADADEVLHVQEREQVQQHLNTHTLRE